MVAGEASGDLLASHLMRALKRHLPHARFVGIGGPKMQAEGFESWWPQEKLAVRGYAEVLRHYRELASIRRQLAARIVRERPAAFIGVDAPDFNLWLERKCKAAGIPAIHYVSPSIWAWRGGRIKNIARSVSHMLCLFPFEAPLYEAAQVPVSYVGHPLADVFPLESQRAAARARLGISDDAMVFALLPGSRQSELQYMAQTYVETAGLLMQRFPTARCLVPFATRETREIFETALWRANAQELPVVMLFGHAHDALAACDAALVASGTATLEAALLRAPHVITYKMSPWSWRIMKRMGYQPWVGLPNIMAGRFVVPEILQDEAQPEILAQALGNLVADRTVCTRMRAAFDAVHRSLRRNTAEAAAAAILPYLRRASATAPAQAAEAV